MTAAKPGFPPRLMGAQLPGGSWAAFNDMLPPPDYASFEFLSKQEHTAILEAAVARAREEGRAEILAEQEAKKLEKRKKRYLELKDQLTGMGVVFGDEAARKDAKD